MCLDISPMMAYFLVFMMVAWTALISVYLLLWTVKEYLKRG